MTYFFCPYLGRKVKVELGTPEHIVPRALGGSDELCVVVQKEANTKLGSDVDAPVIKIYGHRRVQFDLRGHSGREPEMTLEVSVEGKPATWASRRSGDEVRLRTTVSKTTLPDGKLQVSISGDPTEARRIAEQFRKAHEAKGRVVAPFVESLTVMDGPRVDGTFEYDALALGRFQAKLALGIGHWLWGERWSSGKGASALRRSLWSTTAEELNGNAPSHGTMSPANLRIKSRDHEHLFVAVPSPTKDGSVALGLFLFGQAGYILGVATPGETVCEGITAIVVDVTSRKVRRLTLEDMFSQGRLGFSPNRAVPP